MARAKFTASVSEIRGKVRGDVFKVIKDGFALQDISRISNRRTVDQQMTRQAVCHFASNWARLTQAQRDLWDTYGGALTPPLSGQNCYIGLNTVLMTGRHAGLSPITEPPVNPTYATVANPLYCIMMDNSDAFQSDWSTTTKLWTFWDGPASSEVYVKCYYSYMINTIARGKERWNWYETVRSDDQHSYCSLGTYAGYFRRLRLCSIDIYGRAAAYAFIEPDKVTTYELIDFADAIGDWTGSHVVASTDSPHVQGSGSIKGAVSGGTTDGYLQLENLPHPDLDSRDYFTLFLYPTHGTSLPSTIDWHVWFIDSSANVARFDISVVGTQFNRVHLDKANPTSIDPGFDWTQIDYLRVGFDNSTFALDWDFWVDFVFCETA